MFILNVVSTKMLISLRSDELLRQVISCAVAIGISDEHRAGRQQLVRFASLADSGAGVRSRTRLPPAVDRDSAGQSTT